MYSNKINSTPFQKITHAARFDVASAILAKHQLKLNEVLDFGTGDGNIFKYYLRNNMKCNFTGFDVSSEMLAQADVFVKNNVQLTSDLNIIKEKKYSHISCLETLEHIPDENIPGTLQLLRSLLKPNGTLVISVPIESGLSALFKQIIRKASGQSERIATPLAIFLSTIYLTSFIKRDQRDPGHTGFDYVKLRKMIENSGLQIIKAEYSPLKIIGPVFNSQVFYICK